MSGNGRHRKWSGADKLRIVLGAMQPGVEVSDFCWRSSFTELDRALDVVEHRLLPENHVETHTVPGGGHRQ
jgi:hypothetical protein